MGPSYTWYYQRTDSPIHIRLDRMLVNEYWLASYPDSYCLIRTPDGSDHCPIILKSSENSISRHRFLFKNYWVKCDQFLYIMFDFFGTNAHGNLLVDLAYKLKQLKNVIRGKSWANSNNMADQLKLLQNKQLACLNNLNSGADLVQNSLELKNVNIKLEVASSMWFSWIKQRAKAKWLSQGEEDLKFLYARIRLHFFPPGNVISTELGRSLTDPFTDIEIKKAVYSGASNSTHGLDGLNFEFFKTSWVVTGTTVCNAIKSFHQNAYIPRSIKATAITLIPKSNHAETLSDFRSIALCNTSYKIIAKLLAVRMKSLMVHIIKGNQAGFIQHRISTNNVILANEILQHSRKTSNFKLMCIKLDIKKAFDSVSREFLIARMLQKCFPNIFVGWIDACIKEVCFEALSVGDYRLSHLLYANDLILFGKADLPNCEKITKTLKDFSIASGLHINYEKSCDSQFSVLLESIIKKLSGWKAKALSFAGRLQFLRYTIWNSIAYWIRGSIIPKTFIKQIDRLCAKFLYFGDSSAKKFSAKKLHLIAWRNTCLPKEKGGIGLPSLKSLQFSYNCSLIIMIYNTHYPLSVWLFNAYISPWKEPISKAYVFWKNVGKDALLAKQNFHFTVSSTSKFSLYWDHWCKDYTLKEIRDAQPLLSSFPVNESIAVIINGVHWSLPAAMRAFVHSVFSAINIKEGSLDNLYWGDGKNCKHKHYREFYFNDYPNVTWWKFVWHKKYVIRFSSFCWMAIKGGLKTADSLFARGIEVGWIGFFSGCWVLIAVLLMVAGWNSSLRRVVHLRQKTGLPSLSKTSTKEEKSARKRKEIVNFAGRARKKKQMQFDSR
ncbi:uncharacterized protein LOC110108792 [Dendrobium catenatum]|uniref:uncharacterized protein LOC110108792 n=1 Tax=Dendrobium catenatum TaxID=906689 RepID=UPI0009F69729|nr:uncharacterized protein LOC110108792 [Dendrobium catenatum]